MSKQASLYRIEAVDPKLTFDPLYISASEIFAVLESEIFKWRGRDLPSSPWRGDLVKIDFRIQEAVSKCGDLEFRLVALRTVAMPRGPMTEDDYSVFLAKHKSQLPAELAEAVAVYLATRDWSRETKIEQLEDLVTYLDPAAKKLEKRLLRRAVKVSQ